MDKIDELLTRRVDKIYPSKKALEKVLRSGKKLKLYLGVDPTGTNLHLGHVIPLFKLKEFMDLGHEVIFLVGDFTALCGDPSGHEETRRGLTPAEIEKNMATYKNQASKILGSSRIKIKYNAEWLSRLTLKEVIDLASHFTVQQNIERDLFQKRLKKNKPIYLHEFLYPLLQGYDSVAMNVDLEVGGSDQTFNMLTGRTLQKIYHQKEKFVLTVKMMLGTDGKTMSKTSGNTINILDKPADKFGKIMSIIDKMIIHYFEFGTHLALQLIKELEKDLKSGKIHPMELKKRLAFEIVKTHHSEKEARQAQEEFEQVFQKRKMPAKMAVFKTKKREWGIIDLLIKASLAASRGEAKRLIQQGGVKINKSKIKDQKLKIKLKDGTVIRVGKKRFLKIRLVKPN
jgi:tyrosyl-tRNA synthetase